MIGVAIATRGMLFSEVLDSLERERQGHNTSVYVSWDLPIPDSQNSLVAQILEDKKVTHIWFVEEDVVVPEGSLDQLLKLDTDIACIDYGVNGYSCVAKDKKTKEILWCGLGCTLVKREVFDIMDEPYFRTDMSLRLNDWKWINNPSKYGGQDIWFTVKAKEKGFKIKQVETEARHLQITELGKIGWNNGLHQIRDKPKIQTQQIIERQVN